MSTFARIAFMVLMAMMPLSLKAQSTSTAQRYINEGRYREAAQILRPLAEGGDAEATVPDGSPSGEETDEEREAREQQEREAAEQAMDIMLDYYLGTNQHTLAFRKAYSFANRNEDLKRRHVGYVMAECLLTGKGTVQDTDEAWRIINFNEERRLFKQRHPAEYNAFKQKHPSFFETRTVDNPSVGSGSRNVDVVSVTREENRTLVRLRYNNRSRSVHMYIFCDDKSKVYLECNGLICKMISSGLPRYGELSIRPGQSHESVDVFEPLPYACPTFSYHNKHDGGWWFNDINIATPPPPSAPSVR